MRPKHRDILIVSSIFLALLYTILHFLAKSWDISIIRLINKLGFSSFDPNYNIFAIEPIQGIYSSNVFYLAWATSVVITLAVYRLFIYPSNEILLKQSPKIILITCLVGAICVGTLDQMMRIKYFFFELKQFDDKGDDDFYVTFPTFKESYTFARSVREKLKNRHQAEFITNFDLETDPYTAQHRALAYFLYPTISLRLDNKTPKDTFIYYGKNLDEKNIPANQELIAVSPQHEFILTLKAAQTE